MILGAQGTSIGASALETVQQTLSFKRWFVKIEAGLWEPVKDYLKG